MSPPEFELVFAKIKKRWPKFFTEEMEEQVFSICKHLPEFFFQQRVGEVLWGQSPPKIDWFHEINTRYRKSQPVKSDISEMHPNEDSIFDARAILMIREYATRRMTGQHSDTEYHDFQKSLREQIRSRPDIGCHNCLDQGMYLPYGSNALAECKSCS